VPCGAERFFHLALWFVDAGPSGSDLDTLVTIRNALRPTPPSRDAATNDSIESEALRGGLAVAPGERSSSSSFYGSLD